MRLPINPFIKISKLWGEMGNQLKVVETDREVVVYCRLPDGIRREDVEVGVNGSRLMLRGKTNRYYEVKSSTIYREAHYNNQFERVVQLPCPVKARETRIVYHQGIMEIRVPKVQ
jgi:HSP20 family molecular chaperone IbpA